MVRRFGSETVTAVMRRTDPHFELPPPLRNIKSPEEEK
jgi:hypothetical protein